MRISIYDRRTRGWALGVPGCVLLPKKPFAHWRAGKDKCPWYPELTPIKQKTEGDWHAVLKEAAIRALDRIESERGG